MASRHSGECPALRRNLSCGTEAIDVHTRLT
jgi:hypothetical protein